MVSNTTAGAPGLAIRSEVLIAASPERVFDAWADPEEIARWYVERQVGDPRKQDRIVWFVSKADLAGEGETLAVRQADRGRRLVLENVGDEPWHGAVVDVTLTRHNGATRVVVRQTGFDDGMQDHVPNVEAGWACVLAVLKEYVEKHDGQPRRVVEASRGSASDRSLVAQALASPESVARWAGERPSRILASMPPGAVLAFDQHPGVFMVMGTGGAVVWYTGWSEGDLEPARRRAEDLAERLARAVERRPGRLAARRLSVRART
jgi:uncharacterized protein YndB with AHSA1/START domain